jgi:hypothetical protein
MNQVPGAVLAPNPKVVVNSLNVNDKQGLHPLRACRNHITDLYLAIANDGTIDEQFHQLSALGKVEAVQGGLEVLTKGSDVPGQPDEIQFRLRLRLQLVKLLGEPLLVLLALLPLPLKLITLNDGRQVYSQQPDLLTLQLFQCLPARPSSRLQHPDHNVAHTAWPQRTGSTHTLPIFWARSPAKNTWMGSSWCAVTTAPSGLKTSPWAVISTRSPIPHRSSSPIEDPRTRLPRPLVDNRLISKGYAVTPSVGAVKDR